MQHMVLAAVSSAPWYDQRIPEDEGGESYSRSGSAAKNDT